MSTWMQDLRYAIRLLLRTPGFTITALLTLMIGIGATTAIFSVLYAVVLDPLPFHDPGRLMVIMETDPHNNSFREAASIPDLRDWQEQTHTFAAISGFNRGTATLTDPRHEAEQVESALVLWNLFPVLGVRPAIGRSFTAADDVRGAAPVVILGDRLWRERFRGGAVLGTFLNVEGKPHRIIGVMPASYSFPAGASLFLPLVASSEEVALLRGVHSTRAIGRLRDGVTRAAADDEMRALMKRIATAESDAAGRGAHVQSLQEAMVGNVRPRLLLLSGAAAMVLLIGCINIASLMLARAGARARELSIRTSLGASRSRLARQLLVEALVLSLAGAALGIAFAAVTIRSLVSLLPDLPRASAVGMRGPVLLFAIAAGVISALLFGLLPALRASSRVSLRSRGTDRRQLSARAFLVVSELALAVVLIVGTGLFLRSLARLLAVDSGVRTDHVLTAAISLPTASYPVPSRKEYPRWPRAVAFYDQLLARLRDTPGVRAAALALNHPFAPGWTTQIDVEGLPPQPAGSRDEVRVRSVTSGYFEALGIPVLRGRAIEDRDRAGGAEVVVINEAFARRYFPDRDPIGKHVDFWGRSKQIVGVVRGEHFLGLDQDVEPAMYPALSQLPMSSLTIVLRTDGRPLAYAGAVRDAVHGLDPGIAVSDIEPVTARLEQSTATPRLQAALVTLFGCMALLLAAIGLYGLIAYQVQQRTREIGIRVALGAQRAQITTLVVRQGLTLAAIGIAIGIIAAAGTTRFIASTLFQISATDPRVFTAVAAILILVALLASYIPARRAARIDPATALRYE